MHEEAARSTLRTIRRGSLLIVATTLAGLLAGTLWTRFAQPQYTATMVIGPLANQGITGMGTRIAAPGASARLPVNGPEAEQMSDFGRLLAVLTSSPVAAALAADPAVMRKVFADAWSEAAGHWREPEGWGPGLRRMILRLAGRPAWIAPDANQLAAYLRDRV
ncbi:MAG TPA: Wzz/FepE/Etk N-terminal domain-containing protein, partial [Arenibaculum sp.]|nr:Wzz/FepE/Etk N-terminal domain-containing protein [Arenibaculum sp.]